ncbi:hypothetical protein [Ramlibacter algicola]|uniref:Uncharacterized protein n=1 Tax=Ramlibacter algicola TaxID=2795217 RepID=A0A934PZF3_9BURK|nr:hypothetical protein [Ramlibacter algicola]MBK0391484.1 hypothetical protein [Ramlibacter algicola]
MARGIDWSSWQSLVSTLLGLVLVTLVMVGIRLVVMQTIQRKRERENRQINERLKTLIAAYKTLGGSFTGDLAVDPAHLRELAQSGEPLPASDRRRRIRDAVEAALSDVILLGTAEQVELAVAAAQALVAGQRVETAALVRSLRVHIREVLDLDPLPDLAIPSQGPARPGGSSAKRNAGGDARGGRGGGGGGGGAAAGGMGTGAAGMWARERAAGHADDAAP